MASQLALLPNTFEFRQTNFQLNGITPDRILLPNVLRVFLAIQNTTGGRLFIGGNPTIVTGFGCYEVVNGQTQEFYLEKHKILQALEWYAIPTIGPCFIGLLEVLYKGG